MGQIFGNSGAPRWYDVDLDRFVVYVSHLQRCRASAAEIVLHDGEPDEFTARVHVLRADWETVIRGYREAGIRVYLHGPLTPEFALANWVDEPRELLDRYEPLLAQISEVADDQGDTTLVLHGSAFPGVDEATNERMTVECLSAIAERLTRRSNKVRLAIELRARKESRQSAAATSRDSVLRIVEAVNDPRVGICWDVAHDFENALDSGSDWSAPDREFTDRVNHVHIHDLGHDGEPHCPLTIGRVPIQTAINALPDLPAIMEIRWRMAERIGDPWEVLAESYDVVRRFLNHPEDR